MRHGRAKGVKDLSSKVGKKLKKRAAANAVDLGKAVKTKRLVVDTHGVDKERIESRLGLEHTSALAEICLLLRDGLSSKRISGISKAMEFVKTAGEEVLVTQARKLLIELTPRLVDDEALIRQYAQQLVAEILKAALQVQSTQTQVGLLSSLAPTLFTQLKLTVTHIHRDKVLDGLLLTYKVLHAAPRSMFTMKFVTQVMPLLLGHSSMLLLPGKSAKKNNEYTSFDCALQPVRSRWCAVYFVILLNAWVVICKKGKQRDAVLWREAVDRWEEVNFERAGRLRPLAANLRAGWRNANSAQDFPASELLENLLSTLHALESDRLKPNVNIAKLLSLCLCLGRWILLFSVVHQTTCADILTTNAAIPASRMAAKVATILFTAPGKHVGSRTLDDCKDTLARFLTAATTLVASTPGLPWYIDYQLRCLLNAHYDTCLATTVPQGPQTFPLLSKCIAIIASSEEPPCPRHRQHTAPASALASAAASAPVSAPASAAASVPASVPASAPASAAALTESEQSDSEPLIKDTIRTLYRCFNLDAVPLPLQPSVPDCFATERTEYVASLSYLPPWVVADDSALSPDREKGTAEQSVHGLCGEGETIVGGTSGSEDTENEDERYMAMFTSKGAFRR